MAVSTNNDDPTQLVEQFLDIVVVESHRESDLDEMEGKDEAFIDDAENCEVSKIDFMSVAQVSNLPSPRDENKLSENAELDDDKEEQRLTGELLLGFKQCARDDRDMHRCMGEGEEISDNAAVQHILSIIQLEHASASTSEWNVRLKLPDRQFMHMEWVRTTKGIYTEDLALVWYPLRDGKVWKQCRNTDEGLVTVLVVPRERESICGKGKAKEIRPDAKLRHPSAWERSNAAEGAKYLEKYYNGLAIIHFSVQHMVCTTPQADKLTSFAEGNFDVQLWRKVLAQQQLCIGQKVKVISSKLNGHVAVFIGSINRVATIILDAISLADEAKENVQVDLHCLEPCFEVGDVVRTVLSIAGKPASGKIPLLYTAMIALHSII